MMALLRVGNGEISILWKREEKDNSCLIRWFHNVFDIISLKFIPGLWLSNLTVVCCLPMVDTFPTMEMLWQAGRVTHPFLLPDCQTGLQTQSTTATEEKRTRCCVIVDVNARPHVKLTKMKPICQHKTLPTSPISQKSCEEKKTNSTPSKNCLWALQQQVCLCHKSPHSHSDWTVQKLVLLVQSLLPSRPQGIHTYHTWMWWALNDEGRSSESLRLKQDGKESKCAPS